MAVELPHPWQEDPTKKIQSTISLLLNRSDDAKSKAYRELDLGIETLFKTYLSLDSNITGALTSFTRRNQAINGSFYDPIQAVQEAAGTKVENTDLTHIKFYHDLRNTIYHQGNGITILEVHLIKVVALSK